MTVCSSPEKGNKTAPSLLGLVSYQDGHWLSGQLLFSDSDSKWGENTNDNDRDKHLLESPRKDGGEAGVGEREGVEVGQSRQVARAQRGHRRRGEVEVLKQIRKYEVKEI